MNNPQTGKSLKAQNLPWLVSLSTFDILIVAAFVYPVISSAFLSELSSIRALTTLLLPVIVLLITGLLPHDVKASLVYWKLNDVLPGHEAFTKYGLSDARVDMAALGARIGELPTIPKEQNRLWFKLYKAVENTPQVSEAHKMYLLYRDMAAISFLLLLFAPIGFYLSGFGLTTVSIMAGIFALQYLISAVAARHSGVRFVTNVMAIQSTMAATVEPKQPSTRKKALPANA
jgi:hypothetical protein